MRILVFTNTRAFKFYHTRVFKFYHTRVSSNFRLVWHLVASWLGFEIFVNFDLLNYLFFPESLFWSFCRVQNPFFLRYIAILGKNMLDAICECYAMHEWNVYALNSFHLSFLYQICHFPTHVYLTGQLVISFFFCPKKLFISTLASRAVSRFSFLETNILLVQSFI